MWLAVENNANKQLVLEESLDKLTAIQSAEGSDSLMAEYVTSISISSPTFSTVVGAEITPAIAGITVEYTVSGTDGYYKSGSLQTDASGKVSFTIRSGACEVTDTINVWVALSSGISATKTYMWWW